MWKIGNVKIKNQVVLAPMAGISNPAYMKICEEMGCGLVYTELISSEAIIRDNQKTYDMLKGIEKIKIPVAIQLFGSNPNVLALAAQKIEQKYKPAIIDINMGCPVPKVAIKAKAGSGLLKDENKIYTIVKEVVNTIDTPVTVKIRSGWDTNSINAIKVAQICEKAGAKAIAIHPRTRSQGYSGKADWNIIKEIKQNINIPVIGNGDIKTTLDAKKMIKETNCDAVMIARGALGNPWLIKNTINYLENNTLLPEPTKEEKIKMIKKHLSYLLKIKPEKVAIKEMRMHISYYLKGIPKSSKIKQKIIQTTTKKEFIKILDDYNLDRSKV